MMRLIVAIAALFVLAGCDRDEEPNELAPDGKVKLVIDGRRLLSNNATAKLSNTTGEILLVSADFTGSESTSHISISAYSTNTNNVIADGEYKFGSKTVKGSYDGVCQYALNDGNAPFSTTSVAEEYVGKVNITEMDRNALYVSGTFEATVGRNAETKSITKGSFTKVRLEIN